MAPGEWVRSARSDGDTRTRNCDLILQKGTSMAAPFVAGLAVLLRQYFRQGWYPGGRRGQGTPHTPSARFLKALIVNAAEPIAGAVNQNGHSHWVPLAEVPSMQQGHGVPQAHTVLPLWTQHNRTQLWFRDQPAPIAEGQVKKYCLRCAVPPALLWCAVPPPPPASPCGRASRSRPQSPFAGVVGFSTWGEGGSIEPPKTWGGRAFGKRGQCTGPLISYYDFWRRKFFEH